MHTDLRIILFAGFYKISLPRKAQLGAIELDGYEVSLLVKSGADAEITYCQFYVAFDQTPFDYTQQSFGY